MDKPKLGTGSVPVRVAAMAYGKEASWIRAGIIAGWLPIGEATRNGVKITSIEQMNSKYGRMGIQRAGLRTIWQVSGSIIGSTSSITSRPLMTAWKYITWTHSSRRSKIISTMTPMQNTVTKRRSNYEKDQLVERSKCCPNGRKCNSELWTRPDRAAEDRGRAAGHGAGRGATSAGGKEPVNAKNTVSLMEEISKLTNKGD